MDPDGRTYRCALAQPVRLHTSEVAGQIAIELVPASLAGNPPDLPPLPPPPLKADDVAALPQIAVRAGSYQNFTRLVFDWPHDVKYAVFPGAGKLGIRFEALARVDVSAIARFAPPWVKNASWRIDGKGTIIGSTRTPRRLSRFRTGSKVARRAGAQDRRRPIIPRHEKPTITAFGPALRSAAGVIAATAQRLAGCQQACPRLPRPSSKRRRDRDTRHDAGCGLPIPTPRPPRRARRRQRSAHPRGAVLTFTAPPIGSAVFMRGLTAWIAQGAARSTPLKCPERLSVAVEAASAIPRVAHHPETAAQIGAHAEGSNLRVVIAPRSTSSRSPSAVRATRTTRRIPRSGRFCPARRIR